MLLVRRGSLTPTLTGEWPLVIRDLVHAGTRDIHDAR